MADVELYDRERGELVRMREFLERRVVGPGRAGAGRRGVGPARVAEAGRSEAYDAFGMEGKKQLDRLHFPTRRISVEDFVEHLIVEMGVPTKFGKEAALGVLAESRETFEQEKRTKYY